MTYFLQAIHQCRMHFLEVTMTAQNHSMKQPRQSHKDAAVWFAAY